MVPGVFNNEENTFDDHFFLGGKSKQISCNSESLAEILGELANTSTLKKYLHASNFTLQQIFTNLLAEEKHQGA
jgi:hypothetical protein